MPTENRPTGAALALINELFDPAATVDVVTSVASAFPSKNLRSPHRSKLYRSTTVAQQQIAGQFKAAAVPRLFALIDSNVETPASALSVALAKATIWLKADTLNLADNTAVTSWPSVGSNTTPFAQGTAANRPTQQTNELDTKAVVRFDGAGGGNGDYLDRGAALDLGTTHTIIVLFKYSGVVSNQMWLGNGNVSFVDYRPGTPDIRYANNANNAVGVTQSFTVGNWYALRITRAGANVSFFVSGVQSGATQVYTGGDITQGFNLRCIGSSSPSPSNPSAGDLAEVFISTDATFSAADAAAIEDYLIAKWTAPGVLTSVMLELADDSTFASNPQRWVVSSWAQDQGKVLAYYLGHPENYPTNSVLAAFWGLAGTASIYQRLFWRVTLPANAVIDSDEDGTDDTYHELAAIWLGAIEDLVVSDVKLGVESANSTVEARSGARYTDELGNWETIDFALECLELLEAQRLLDLIRRQGARHCILDLHGNTTDAELRRYSARYGFVSERRGLSSTLHGGSDNSVDVAFEEARG